MAEISIPKTLEPCSKQTPSQNPLLSNIFIHKNVKKWPIKVNFPGCRKPHQNWANWVEKLSVKYAKIWELTGICDGILSSLHEIQPNPEIILAVSEFWCSKTNTFIFPWGESTVTLEDLNVLLGLPILGENVDFSLSEGLSKNLEQKLHQVKTAISISNCEVDAWINYFNQEKDETEHVGFLAYWLSMFVFPDLDDRTIGNHVFSIAVNLAQGVKIALAPPVLACLYHNLTFITKQAADFDSVKKEISVPAPFQVLQIWVFERFPWLGSKLAKPLSLGYPRIARWNNVNCKANLVDVRKGLISSAGSFCWKPYALDLKNWKHKFLCIDLDKVLSTEFSDDDDELESFRSCLQPRKLIGIDCSATYQPQRVLIQFGCDQKVHKEYGNHSKNGNEIAIVEGFEQEKNDEVDHQKTKLDTDEADVSPESEILNVSGDENGTKQNFRERIEEKRMEDMVLLDSEDDDDDEVNEVLSCRDVNQTRRKRLKRRIGDSADYPLFINEYSFKVVKKSGVSFGNPIDVEKY